MSSLLSSREKKIILLIINAKKHITIQTIAQEIGVSRRTILREMPGVYDWFIQKGYEVIRTVNKGLSLELTSQEKTDLLLSIEDADVIQYYTKHERQLFIITELLQTKDSQKLYYFASTLGVSEATISHDLNGVDEWLQNYDLTLERKQGYGVEVLGRERSKRKALINILYEMLDGKLLKNAVSNQLGLSKEKKSTTVDIRNKLLNMIDINTVQIIEHVITQSETDMGFKFAESSYTALAVHLALAIQRIQNGEKIVIQPDILENIKLFDEYIIANKLITSLETSMNLTIPEDETGYVTMHLKGARYKNGIYDTSILKFNELIISNYQLTSMINEMIKVAEKLTGYELRNVDSLLIGLVDHLRPAINRMQMNLDIRNPLLKKIKEEYKEIFEVSKACADVIQNHLGYSLPESEIGYIAMHLGSAIEQIKNTDTKSNRNFNIIVTCISGIGTSKMLAERIKKEFKTLNIVEVFSTTNVKDNWLQKNDIDLIVSTVHFENDIVPVISVNPLLLEKDVEKLNQKLQTLELLIKTSNQKEPTSSFERIKQINLYSEAIIELLNNFNVYKDLNITTYNDLIQKVSTTMTSRPEILQKEIVRREEIGSIIFTDEQVIFLHTRSEVIQDITVGIFRNKQVITNKDGSFKTAIVLLAPTDVPKEKLEVIGEVSSRLVSEENLLQDITYEYEESLRQKFEEYMNQFFNRKLKRK